MTPETRQFVWLMRILAFVYLLTGLFFFFRAEETFYLINVGPKVFRTYEELPASSEHFWLVLATSMMGMLFMTAVYSSRYPKVLGFVLIHLVAKIISTSGFLFLFLREKQIFGYLVGAAVDGLLIVLVAGFFIRNLAAKPGGPKGPLLAEAAAPEPEHSEQEEHGG